MATALSPEVQLMRRRVRHVHIPDLPPIYAPRSLATNIRDHIQGQITSQRALIEEPSRPEPEYGLGKITSGAQTSFTSWLERAGPPPTVLSFTRRPTYILPKHQVERQEPWQIEYLTKALKSRLNIHFPAPPGWSSLPWRPSWEQKLPESEWKHDPLDHQWPDVGVLVMPCAEAMFLGPGQVSIWPIVDLKDDIQRGRARLKTKYQFERILEDTTIEILKREFRIQAFAIPGSTGVWVESMIPPAEVDVDGERAAARVPESLTSSLRRRNVRRIATIHASVTDDITQWGVSIHVGQPDPTVDAWARSTNPWTPLRQHHTTTSIAAELTYKKSTASPLGPSKYLLTHFNQNEVPLRAGQGYVPYSRIKVESGKRCPAPLGMDNRDISTAWTYEFARQLGMNDGHVDHYSMVDANQTDVTHLPTKTTGAGFRFRGVFSEDVMNGTYRQVEVPSIQVGRNERAAPGIVEESMRQEHHDQRIDMATHEGWLLSWSLWESSLVRKLDDAIRGGPCDTRLRAYELQKQASSRLQRRRTELKEADEVEEGWRREMPQLIRRPLSDGVIRELADHSREMEAILKTVRMGRKSERLLDSTIQMRRLLVSSFAGALGGHPGAAGEPRQSEPSSATETAPEAPPTAQANTPAREPEPKTLTRKPEVNTLTREPEAKTLTREPEVNTSTREPQANTLTREPKVNTTTREPEVNTATREPEVNTPAREPEAKALTRNPEAKTSTREPEVNTSTREPEAKPLTREPEVNTSTREPKAKPLTREPEVNTSTREPEAKPLTREPEVNTSTRELKAQPSTLNPQADASTQQHPARRGEWVDLTDTKAKKHISKLQERMEMAAERAAARRAAAAAAAAEAEAESRRQEEQEPKPLTYKGLELARERKQKPKPSMFKRLKLGKEDETAAAAGRGPRDAGASQFLPNQHQIGGGGENGAPAVSSQFLPKKSKIGGGS